MKLEKLQNSYKKAGLLRYIECQEGFTTKGLHRLETLDKEVSDAADKTTETGYSKR